MLEPFDSSNLFAMAELNQLRAHAVDLFDRCLTEGNRAPIVAFIEKQLASDPPHLQFLREFADDLQQRLLSLRAYHFDVRKNVVQTLAEDYGVDITPLAPADALDRYHLLNPPQVLAYVREHGKAVTGKDSILLGKLLEVSIKAAERLHRDITLTAELQNLVLDWFEAHSSTMGRRNWPDDIPPGQAIH
jgi:hypothetical protein